MSMQTRMKGPGMMMGSGRTLAAVAVMMILAAYQILQGIRAVIVGGTFVDASGFAYRANNTAFGWLHIALGALVALTAFALISGRAWARAAAVVAVVLVAVASFFWIPYIPVFALVLVALSVFVIWAATTGGRQNAMQGGREEAGAGQDYYEGGGAPSGERWPAANAPRGRDWEAENRQTTRENQAQAQERADAEARSGRGRPPNNPPER